MKTKMQTYIARSDAESRGLRDGTITVLVIPMSPQPPEGYESHGWSENCLLSVESWTFVNGYARWFINAPYISGDEIRVKAIRTRLLCRSVEVQHVDHVWSWIVEVEAID